MANKGEYQPMQANEDKTNKEETIQPTANLKKYIKRVSLSTEAIQWNGTVEDYAEYDLVLRNFSMDKLKRMLIGGAPYLYKADDVNYPITHIAFYSRTDIMEIILERHKEEGSSEDTKEFRQQTCEALYTVCLTNCGDIARVLLQVDTPVLPTIHLNQAAENGSTAVLDEIITSIPDISVNCMDNEGNTPLFKAVERKHKHTVKYLLNQNALPNIANYSGYNSVHMACQYADEDILYLLTKRGGDVNARENRGKTPALIAAENGKEGCIHILAAAGASLDQRDKQGIAPLIIAASQGHTNTVKELILNGASFDVTDNQRYNALERAITNKKDGAAAIIIRLSPQSDYVGYYLLTVEISLFKIVRYRLTETLKALLDKMVVQDNPLDAIHGVVRTKYLDLDTDNLTPDAENYQNNKTFLLQRIAGLNNEEIAHHGTIRLYVDKKMNQYGNRIIGIKLLFYTLFLLALAYSLIVASYVPIQLSVYGRDVLNIARIPTELFVLCYFIFNVVTEAVEFFRVTRLTFRYTRDKSRDRTREKQREETITVDNNNNNEDGDSNPPVPKPIPAKRSITSRLNDNIFVRIFTDYFSDKSNYLDVLGLLTLFILIILRVTTQPTQWVFATVTFLINGLRVFKLVALLPRLGPYTNIIYKILINDVPLFSTLFGLTLLIFTGGYFISLRAPYSLSGFTNATLMTDTDRTYGVDNEVQWVFLSGLRVLLEGNVYEGQYLYRQLNWLAASLYLAFLFLTVVVFMNVFIAQLSDTYGVVRKNAERTYAWQRLNFIVQVQRTSLMSICIDHRKKYFIKEIAIDKDDLFKYYGVHNIKALNTKNFTESVDVKGLLASIQNQQIVARQTHEISQSANTSGPPPQVPPPPTEQSQQIQELSERIDQLIAEMRQKEALWEERMDRSNQALLGMIEEKLRDLK